MKSISDRITDIKGELDELESHVNSTLSILDCKPYPLKEHCKEYKEWKWKESNKSYNTYLDEKYHSVYTKEETLEKLDKIKKVKDATNKKNIALIKQNTITFNKLCDFFEKLGLKQTRYVMEGTGKRRCSRNVESDWLRDLHATYPMIDSSYEAFISWHKQQVKDISAFFLCQRRLRVEKEREQEEKRLQREAKELEAEAEENTVNMAIALLVSKGKKVNKDFTKNNAIEEALKLKLKLDL